MSTRPVEEFKEILKSIQDPELKKTLKDWFMDNMVTMIVEYETSGFELSHIENPTYLLEHKKAKALNDLAQVLENYIEEETLYSIYGKKTKLKLTVLKTV
jgi:hypothetical protein